MVVKARKILIKRKRKRERKEERKRGEGQLKRKKDKKEENEKKIREGGESDAHERAQEGAFHLHKVDQ